MKLLKKATITFLVPVILLFSFAACEGTKAQEKPWLKSSRTDSQAETFSQAVGESNEGTEETLASAPTPTSSPATEAREISEEDKQQSVYWNGVGTSFYRQFFYSPFISSRYAVEAWMKAIELNPKNVSPYLHIIDVAFSPEDAYYGGFTIPDYPEYIKRFREAFTSSGLKSVSLSDEDVIYTLDFDQAANTLTLTEGEERVRTLYYDENGALVKDVCEKYMMTFIYSLEYNENGQLASVVEKVDSQYTKSLHEHSHSYQYNEIGQLIKSLEHYEECYENDDSEQEKTHKYTREYNYEYNSDGSLAREFYTMTTVDGISTEHETLYTYDAQGRLIQKTCGYIYEERNLADSYSYDANGNLVKIERTESGSSNGSEYTSEYTYKYTFDERGWICGVDWGNREEIISLDDYGNRETDGKNTYDADGNPTHAWGYDIEYTFAE